MNFVFIFTDTQCKSMVGAYGQPVFDTPNLDRLAGEGIRFERAYTACPVCTPARGAIFTGQHPQVNGAWANDLTPHRHTPMMGEIFRYFGYRAGYTGKWHLDGSGYDGTGVPDGGFEQDWWYDRANLLADLPPEIRSAYSMKTSADELRRIGFGAEHVYGRRVVDRAVDFLQRVGDDPFTLVVSLDEPHDPWIVVLRASLHAELGDYESAIADCDSAIELDPDSAFAYRVRATVFESMGRLADAERDFARAEKLEPWWSRRDKPPVLMFSANEPHLLYLFLAGQYMSEGLYPEAVETLDDAVAFKPDFAEGYALRGEALAAMGQYDRALEDLARAIELDSEIVEAYVTRCRIHGRSRGELESVLADCSRAIELDSSLPDAYAYRAAAFAQTGECARAVVDAETAVRLGPASRKAHHVLGIAHLCAGNAESAIVAFGRAIELEPNEPVAYVSRAGAFAALGEHDRVVEDLTRALDLDPDLAIAYLVRGSAYAGLDDTERARSDLRRFLELSDDASLSADAERLLNDLS